MSKIQFSARDKNRLYRNLIQAGTMKESEGLLMKTNKMRRAVVVAAACFMITGVTVFAASRIVSLTASSRADFDFHTASELNAANQNFPDYPESFDNGFTFKGGNIVKTGAQDESGNTVDSWDDYSGIYENASGKTVDLSVTHSSVDAEDQSRTASSVKEIAGITVRYNYDEYLVVSEGYELTDAEKDRMENDDHFFVSEGSEERETYYFSSVSFEQDGVYYLLSTFDDVSEDTLYTMAAELITK